MFPRKLVAYNRSIRLILVSVPKHNKHDPGAHGNSMCHQVGQLIAAHLSQCYVKGNELVRNKFI